MSKEAGDDDSTPSWMLPENDDKHRRETAPLLFGEGKLDLQDPEAPEVPAEEQVITYGSTTTDKDKKLKSEGDDFPELNSREDILLASSDHPELSEAALARKPHVPPINPCLWMFHLLQGVGVAASLCLVVTQILPLIITPKDEILSMLGLGAIALKIYISCFCIVFCLVELDVPVFFVRDSTLLQRFLSRGFLYSFLGLICVEEAYSERVRDIVSGSKDAFHVGWAAVFMQISSWLMLGTGVVYMLLGIFCLKRLKDKMREDEREAWKTYRVEMKAWKELYAD